MTRKSADPFSGLESGVAGAVKGSGGGAKAVVDTVAEVYAAALRASDQDVAALFDDAPALADSAVRGAVKAGGDLHSVARGFLLGALRGSRLEGEPALQAAAHASHAFIKSVHDAGGDEAGAAAGLVEGVLVWAGEVGQEAERAAVAVGQAAADAADRAGAKTGREVRDALRVQIAGVSIVLKKR